MAFGNENDFKYIHSLDYNSNIMEFGDNSNYKKLSNNNSNYAKAGNDYAQFDNVNYKIFGNDSDFKAILATNLGNSPFGNSQDFKSIISKNENATFAGYNNFAPISNQRESAFDHNSSMRTINKNIKAIPFGNDYDFIYVGIGISWQEQDLTASYYEQDVQSAGISNRECGRIDIGNMYAQYELQRPCDCGNQLYARYCPCDDATRTNCDCAHRSSPSQNSPCKSNKIDACKLARKIYQQIMFASSKVASLITCAPCQCVACELVDSKKMLDTLAVSMLPIVRKICHGEPIFMHGNEDDNGNFNQELDNVIKLLSNIIQNIIQLQKMPEGDCVENALILVAFGVMAQQNRLIAIL